jgi:hypothetical protein
VTRPIRRASDLTLAALDIRRAGELLLHPCGCNGRDHSLGEHLWRSTADMEPGIRASNTDPRVVSSGQSDPSDSDTDPTVSLRRSLQRIVQVGVDAAEVITDFVTQHRPDRTTTEPAKTTDDDWCRCHLAAGLCEPRFRNHTVCRWCYEFDLAYRMDPPTGLLLLRHQSPKLKDSDVTEAVRAERLRLKGERKRKRKAG